MRRKEKKEGEVRVKGNGGRRGVKWDKRLRSEGVLTERHGGGVRGQ